MSKNVGGLHFFDLRRLQDKMSFWTRFGGVWGPILEAFWAILGGFSGFEKKTNFESKLKTEKVVTESRGGLGSESAGGYGGPNIGK